MPQNNQLTRTPGIRVNADGQRVGAVYGLRCPALDAELMDATPLNAGWRTQRPVRRRAEDLRLKMLFRPTDAGQALMVQKYRTGESLSVSLVLPDGNTLGWQGWVRGLTFSAAHPDAPVTLEAAVCVNGEMEVSA